MNLQLALDTIFEQPVSSHAKLVYMYLVRRADKHGQSYPGYARIAQDTGLSRSAIIRAMKELVEAGLLNKVFRGRKDTHEFATNVYTVIIPAKSLNSADMGSVSQTLPTTGQSVDDQQGIISQTIPKTTQTSKGFRSKERSKDQYISAREIIDLYNQLCPDLTPASEQLTPQRDARIQQLYDWLGSKEAIARYFTRANSIPFLHGENRFNWRAGLDFLTNPDKIVKITERTYDPIAPTQQPNKRRTTKRQTPQTDRDAQITALHEEYKFLYQIPIGQEAG